MKTMTLFLAVLTGLLCVTGNNASAGAAVAWDGTSGNLATAYGGPVKREMARALETARHRYGANFRILAATDVTGYGAIAVARQPSGHGYIVGVVLGKKSHTEAVTIAVNDCLRAGGLHPVVKWAWEG